MPAPCSLASAACLTLTKQEEGTDCMVYHPPLPLLYTNHLNSAEPSDLANSAQRFLDCKRCCNVNLFAQIFSQMTGSQDDHSLFGGGWVPGVPTALRLTMPSPEQPAQTPPTSPHVEASPRRPGSSRSSAPKSPKPRTSPPPEPAGKPAEPVRPPPQKTEAKPVSTALAIPVDYIIRDLGIKDVDLVIGGNDPTSGAVVAFPVRRMNLISASTVLADMLKTKPPAFGAGPDSIKTLPYLKLDENALLMERILPFLFNDLDLPKTTDIHFIRAVYQAAHKYKMRRLFDWMTEKLRYEDWKFLSSHSK